MQTEFKVSVGELVSFCHRRGDIDYRYKPSPSAVEGIAGHQAVYADRADSYLSEHSVQYVHVQDNCVVKLVGRVDGFDANEALVEEIKTCRVRAHLIPATLSQMHLAQARLYAAMIAIEHDLPALNVRLTWFNIDSKEQDSLDEYLLRAELEAFLDASLAKFSQWIARLAEQREQRDQRIAELAFPMGDFRKGQREMAELVYKCIDQAGELLVEAPTGIGKTAAVLYPALKALATDKHDRIVFTTAKTVGRRAVESTLERFQGAGLHLRALSLSAKERICFSPGKACHRDDCRYARGYYDRLPQALWAAMESPSLYQSDIESLAKRFDICPYQLSLDLLPWIDLVIADIHYLYSLTATIGSLVQQGNHRWSVLLDEAHNLPARARKLFRAEIAKAELMAARRDAPRSLARALNRINRVLLEIQRRQWASPEHESLEQIPASLMRALTGFLTAAGDAMAAEAGALHGSPKLLEFYFSAIQFLRLADYWGVDFRCELSRTTGSQSLKITINCLDPARLLAAKQKVLHSVTAFSA
ncbi:MAG: DEAD/DEAH box helicase, partial [Pseudomonadota bacterium]